MEPQNQVTAEITLELSDLYWLFGLKRWSFYRYALVIAFCLLVVSAIRIWPSSDSNFMLIVAAALAAIFLYPWFRIRNHFRNYPAYRKPRRFTFDVEGMHLESEDARGDYKWSLFAEIVETKQSFIFRQTSSGGTPVPKRFLAQPDDIPKLRTLIRENFNGKRRLRID